MGGFYAFVVAAIGLVLALILASPVERRWILRRLGIAAGSLLLAYGWLWLDPGRTVEWFLD